MRRRDLSRALLSSAAGSILLPQPAPAQTLAEPRYPRHPAEIAAKITPTDYTHPQGNVLRYGADPTGSNDSSPAFDAACRSGAGVVTVPTGSYKVASTITVDIAKIAITGQSATLHAALSRGPILLVTSSTGPEDNTRSCISGLEFAGTNVPGVYGVNVEGRSPSVAGCSFRNCSFTSLDKFVQIYSHAFMLSFNACTFSQGGASGGIHVPTGGGDYGERISFTDCNFFNNEICLKADYPAEFYLSGCSLDYSKQIVLMSAGYAFLTNCFIENKYDEAHWFTTGPAGATILLNSCTIAQTGPKPNYEIANSSSQTGTLNFRNCQFYSSGNVVRAALVAGTGGAFGSGNNIDGFANNAYAWSIFSRAAQLCSNGTFAHGLNGWTCGSHSGGAGAPSVRRNSLILKVPVDGQDQFAYWTVNAAPGEIIGFVCDARVSDAAASFRMTIRCMGADGSAISTSPAIGGLNSFGGSNPLNTKDYTQCRATISRLPAGTASVQLEVSTAGPASTSHEVWIQDVVIGKY